LIRHEGLTHIHLVVRDMARSLRFYRDVFGLEEQYRAGPHLIFLRSPGARDTITLNDSPEEVARAGDSGGIAHFGFRLASKDDLSAGIAEAERAGGRLVRRGEHEPGHPFAYIADPDGYVIEL
jgi:catechol 2,3-dioxygenase-like lactoylglutathione lyase family enzyme